MGNLTSALVFVMFVNVLLFLSQYAMIEMNPDGTVFFNCEGSMLKTFDKNKCVGSTYVLDDSDITGELPSSEGAISPTTGNFFTDIVSSIKDWFTSLPGIKYLYAMLSAPANLLKNMGAPDALSFALGALWYGVTFFLVVEFFWGGRG